MALKMEHADAIKGISNSLERMEKDLKYSRDDCLKIIGSTVKGNVQASLKRSNKRKKKKIPHMKDDVVFEIKTSRRGERYVSVKGGKKTGKLWHLVNDGHVAENGKVVPGKHFIETAMAKSDKEIDAIIDSFLGEILDG